MSDDASRRAKARPILVVLGAVVGISGGDEFVTRIAAAWRAAGCDVGLLTTAEGSAHALAVGFPDDAIHIVKSFRRRGVPLTATYALRALALAWAAARITRTHRGHLTVFAASFFPPDMLAVAAALMVGAREWVLSWQLAIPPPWIRYEDANRAQRRVRLPRYGQSLSYLAQQAALAAFRRRGSLLVVPTRQMAGDTATRGIRPDRIAIVRYGIDLAAVASADVGTRDGFSVVFLGRFHSQKGLDDLPRIWRRVREHRPDATLGIIGGGDDRIERCLRTELGGLDVTFLGVRTGGGKYRLLSHAKVLAFPSHYESWGHVVLEAMACDLAVVGYEIPSSREAFGDAIVYRPLGDAEGLGDAIAQLLGNEGLRQRYVAMGRALARSHDWHSIAADLFERIASVSEAPRAEW